MKIGSHDTKDFSPLTKLLLVIGAILFVSLPYVTQQVRGLTQIGTTISTNPDLESGLVLHYTFDGEDIDISNGSAEIIDRGSGSNDGDWINHATTTVPGVLGQGIEFDGTNDYIDTNNTVLTGTSERITLAIWLKPDRLNGFNQIMGKREFGPNNGYAFTFRGDIADDPLQFTIYGVIAQNSSATNLDVGEWAHVAVTYDKQNIIFYVNGAELSSHPQTGEITHANGNDLFIGANSTDGTPSGYFDGAMDDVRIYDRVLSAEEISRLYELGATTKIGVTQNNNPDLENGLLNHYTFDGEQQTALFDRSGNGHDGWLIDGANATTTKPGKIGQSLFLSGDNFDAGVALTTGSLSQSTACLWTYMESLEANDDSVYAFVALSDSMYLGYNKSTDKFRYAFDTDAGTLEVESATTPYAKEWYHLCVIYEGIGTNATLYVNAVSDNGALDSAGSGSPILADTNIFVIGSIGGTFSGNTGNPNSRLDDIRYYDRVLSVEEISRLYELGATTHVGVTQNNNPDLDSGLVLYYPFDGKDIDLSSGTAEILDRSGNGSDGNWLDHSTTTRPGVLGQAIQFNGTGEAVKRSVSNYRPGDTTGTISAWVKGSGRIFSSADTASDQYYFVLSVYSSSERLVVEKSDNDLWHSTEASNSSFSDGGWHHVALVSNGSAWSMYVDGVSQTLIATQQDNDGDWFADVAFRDNFVIGGLERNAGLESGFSGAIDDLRIYNRALSAEEIERLYQMGN